MRIYCASRTRHAEMWRGYRARGVPIISTWIDEPGPPGPPDLGAFWARVVAEVASATELVLFAQTGDFPLKGALVEVGVALSHRVPVTVVTDVQLDRDHRPLGSWVRHPLVTMPTWPWIEADATAASVLTDVLMSRASRPMPFDERK